MGRAILEKIIGPNRGLRWGTTMWKESSVGFWQQIQDESGIQLVLNLPHPPCPHACEPFQLNVLKIAGRYYPEPLVQPV